MVRFGYTVEPFPQDKQAKKAEPAKPKKAPAKKKGGAAK